MDLSEADRVLELMESIESPGAEFDPGKAKHAISLVREFVARAQRYLESRGLPLITPFIDPTEGLPVVLPEPLTRRLREWEEGPSDLNPYVGMACRSYLRYLAASEDLSPDQREQLDIYAPLIQLLTEGGTFYEHHGDICVPDVGTLFLARRRPPEARPAASSP